MYNPYQLLAILHPSTLANLVVEVRTRHSHQMVLHVEDGTMCRNCSRPLDTIQKNVDKFHSRGVGSDSPVAKHCALEKANPTKRLAVCTQVFATILIKKNSYKNLYRISYRFLLILFKKQISAH